MLLEVFMETASSVINDALQELIIQASEQAVQSVDFQTGIRYLNRMMASFDAQGISLGYTKVDNAADEITVPDGAIEGMIFNLALRLSTSYDIPVGPSLALNARDGLEAMRALSVEILPSSYPCTLPIGSGNEGEAGDEHYYPCSADELLEEQGGAMLLEDETANDE